MLTVLSSVYVFICLLLLIVVLLQQGKGGDIAAAFGGGGSQTAFGARAGATVLTRATSILGTLFMLGALALSIIGQRGGGGSSVVGGVDAPAPAPQTAPAPTTPPTTPPGQPEGAQPPAPEQKPGETKPPGGGAS